MQRIKGLAPAKYKSEVDATEQRLSQLFDALNNDDVKAEHAVQLTTLAGTIQARDFDQAQSKQATLAKDIGSAPWMVSGAMSLHVRVSN